MNIYQKLQKARVELQELDLKKSGKNTYSNFTYYELGDFLPAINKLCNKHGLFTKFNIVTNKRVEKAVLSVLDAEKPVDKLDFISNTAEVEIGRKKDGRGGAQPIQNLGGKITYMRRYMLMTAFEMVESDRVEEVKRELTDEIPEEDVKKIKEAKDFESLTKICGSLKKDYKAKLIKPHYDKRKEELEDNVKKVKK